MTSRMHVLLIFMSTVPLASPSYAGLQERSEAVDDGKDLLTWIGGGPSSYRKKCKVNGDEMGQFLDFRMVVGRGHSENNTYTLDWSTVFQTDSRPQLPGPWAPRPDANATEFDPFPCLKDATLYYACTGCCDNDIMKKVAEKKTSLSDANQRERS